MNFKDKRFLFTTYTRLLVIDVVEFIILYPWPRLRTDLTRSRKSSKVAYNALKIALKQNNIKS